MDYSADLSDVLWIAGQSARSFGLYVESAEGWADTGARQWTAVTVPGVAGTVRASTVPREDAATVTVTGVLIGSDANDLRAKRDALIYAFSGSDPVEVIFADNTTRYLLVDSAALTMQPLGPSMAQSRQPVTLVFTALDPRRYDVAETVVSAAAGAHLVLPLGTAEVRPVIAVEGPADGLTLSLYAHDGTLVEQMVFTTNVLAGHTLTVDCAALTAMYDAASALGDLASGDFVVLDPTVLADRGAAAWPYLVCSAGTATVTYRRAWR